MRNERHIDGLIFNQSVQNSNNILSRNLSPDKQSSDSIMLHNDEPNNLQNCINNENDNERTDFVKGKRSLD